MNIVTINSGLTRISYTSSNRLSILVYFLMDDIGSRGIDSIVSWLENNQSNLIVLNYSFIKKNGNNISIYCFFDGYELEENKIRDKFEIDKDGLIKIVSQWKKLYPKYDEMRIIEENGRISLTGSIKYDDKDLVNPANIAEILIVQRNNYASRKDPKFIKDGQANQNQKQAYGYSKVFEDNYRISLFEYLFHEVSAGEVLRWIIGNSDCKSTMENALTYEKDGENIKIYSRPSYNDYENFLGEYYDIEFTMNRIKFFKAIEEWGKITSEQPQFIIIKKFLDNLSFEVDFREEDNSAVDNKTFTYYEINKLLDPIIMDGHFFGCCQQKVKDKIYETKNKLIDANKTMSVDIVSEKFCTFNHSFLPENLNKEDIISKILDELNKKNSLYSKEISRFSNEDKIYFVITIRIFGIKTRIMLDEGYKPISIYPVFWKTKINVLALDVSSSRILYASVKQLSILAYFLIDDVGGRNINSLLSWLNDYACKAVVLNYSYIIKNDDVINIYCFYDGYDREENINRDKFEISKGELVELAIKWQELYPKYRYIKIVEEGGIVDLIGVSEIYI